MIERVRQRVQCTLECLVAEVRRTEWPGDLADDAAECGLSVGLADRRVMAPRLCGFNRIGAMMTA
jgi:hypothetical protein